MTATKTIRLLKTTFRAMLLAATVTTPLLAVQNVNAGTETLIGEMQTMSSGAGLILLVGLRRS